MTDQTPDDIANSIPAMKTDDELLKVIGEIFEQRLYLPSGTLVIAPEDREVLDLIAMRSMDADIDHTPNPESLGLAFNAMICANRGALKELRNFAQECVEQNLQAFAKKHTPLETADKISFLMWHDLGPVLPATLQQKLLRHQEIALTQDVGDDADERRQAICTLTNIHSVASRMSAADEGIKVKKTELVHDVRQKLAGLIEQMDWNEYPALFKDFPDSRLPDEARYNIAMDLWKVSPKGHTLENKALQVAFKHADGVPVFLARVALRARPGSELQKETEQFFPRLPTPKYR